MRSSASGIMELPISHFHNERSSDSASTCSLVEHGSAAKRVDGANSNSTRRKLSMYASVTNIIPDLDDQSRILGCILLLQHLT
ncbi:hypothetical protein ABKV19_000712 [Rosa sericea]